jgi:magnesium chelatase family protein
MLAKVFSSSILGLEVYKVEIEVDITHGLPRMTIVGLPDTAIKESKERIKSAIKNSGYVYPEDKITVNLAPADIKKEGPIFDLPIALGILAASGQINIEHINNYLILGELALDGKVRPVNGTLPIALSLKNKEKLILPKENIYETAIIKDIEVYGVESLTQAIGFLSGIYLFRLIK